MAWITPKDIMQWNAASEEWHCPDAQIDLSEGGRFSYRMEAKDGSMGFDFEGTFTVVQPKDRIEFTLGDDRRVEVSFTATGEGVRVVETFEVEDEHTAEQQRQGWLSILNNFKKHVESP